MDASSLASTIAPVVVPLAERLAEMAARALPPFLDVTLKATAVLAAAHLVTRWGMRHAAAATRHLVWSAAVAAVLALPVLAAVAPRWTAPVVPGVALRVADGVRGALAATAGEAAFPPASPAPATAAPPFAPAAGRDRQHPARPGAASSLPSSAAARVGTAAVAPARTPPPARWPAAFWAAALWAAGALAVLARLALGTLGLARLVRRARPADDPAWVMPMQRLARELGVRRPVTLLVGRTGTVPVTWGVVYPVVLLPADAAAWTPERRRLVLLHELAHVARLDAFTQTLAQLVTALFWFNPLAVLAARRLRTERERACDDLVLGAGVRATTYADDLLDLVRTLGDASPAAAALAMARRSEFEGRLLAILDPRAPRAGVSARRALVAAALVGAVAVPLAGMRAAVAGGPAGPPATRASRAPAAPAAPTSFLVPTGTLAAARARRDTAGRPRLASAVAPTADGCSRVRGQYFVVGGPGTTYRIVDDTRCLEVHVRGLVEFTEDDADVHAVAPGGGLVVTETRAGHTRRMEVTAPSGASGTTSTAALARRYTVDEAERPVAEGTTWFRDALAGAVRRGGLGTEARVARLRREGGALAVLAAARRQEGDAVRRRYLEALLAGPALAPAELEQVALAARALDGRSARAAVLRRVAAQGAGSPAVVTAVIGAARGLPEGDHRRVLEQTTADRALTPAMVADLARAAGGMTSDGDKAAVLGRLAARAAASDTARAAFYAAVNTFTSDGERQRVLLAALGAPRAGPQADDARVLVATLDALAPMTSDAGRTEVLAAVAARRPFHLAAVRKRYFARVDEITSESSRERALLAALTAGEPCDEAVDAVLASSARFTSDRARANVLLAVAARSNALARAESRTAFLAALRPITSSTEYRRVMEAVVPR